MKIHEFSSGYNKIFPQANDIYKVIQIVVLNRGNKSEEKDIMDELEISTTRQVHYYRKAACFLGLFDENNQLTKSGKLFADQSIVTQLELMVYLILSIDIFYDYFINRNKNGAIQKISETYGYNATTSTRRFSTIESWIFWCDVVVSDYNIEIESDK